MPTINAPTHTSRLILYRNEDNTVQLQLMSIDIILIILYISVIYSILDFYFLYVCQVYSKACGFSFSNFLAVQQNNKCLVNKVFFKNFVSILVMGNPAVKILIILVSQVNFLLRFFSSSSSYKKTSGNMIVNHFRDIFCIQQTFVFVCGGRKNNNFYTGNKLH